MALQQGAVRTPVPAGETVTVNYTAVVDAGQPAGSSLANTATVSYSTRSTADGHVTPGTNNVADDNTDAASVTLDGCTITKSGPAGPFTIGEKYTYNLDVTVPARAVAFWPSVTDSLNREGFVATGTPTISTLAGAPLTGAAFASTVTAPVRSTPASGSTLFTFDLSDPIDNSNSASAYTFRVSFDVIYAATRGAGSWEFAPPAAADSATDTGRILWNTVHAASRATNSSALSNVVSTSFQQPLLRSAKSIVTTITPGPYVGGGDIVYRVAVTNTGSSRAYDVSFIDTMPAAASAATLTVANLTGVGDVKSNASITSTTTVLRVNFDSGVSIGTSQTLTLEYRVTLAPNIGAGVTLTNTADVNWSSLSGTPGDSRRYNDGTYENWTLDTSTATTSAAPATISKRASTAGPIRIGDTVTYSIDCTVPANTVAWWPVISDRIDKRGVSYVASSAVITTRNNPPSVPATFGVSSTPTATLTAGNSTTYAWALANPVDNSGNPQPYGFTLSFTVQYNGLLNATTWEMWPAGTAAPANSISDTASVQWRDVGVGGPTTNKAAVTNAVVTTVRQPLVRTTKSIVTTLTPPPFVGGSPIRYRVTMTNPGYNTAYDLTATDTFPAEIASANLAVATETGVGDIMSSLTTAFALPNATVTFGPGVSLGTTQTITLEFDCVLAPSVGAGATLTNSADANWSSQPGAVAGERLYNDSTQEGATWTQDTTSVTTSTPVATFGKRIVSGNTTGTIGSVVIYSLDTTVPANETAYSLVVTDTVPDYLTVVAASASLPGTVTIGAAGPSGTLVTYSGGSISAGSSAATVSVSLICQVRDFRYSGPQVPSGAINNSALLAWQTRASGGATLTAGAGPVAYTVVQPTLTVTKTATPATAGPGDTVTYTSVVTNTGNSPAYDFAWSDVSSAQLSTPTLGTVKPSGLATLTAGTDFTTASTATSLAVTLRSAEQPANRPGTDGHDHVERLCARRCPQRRVDAGHGDHQLVHLASSNCCRPYVRVRKRHTRGDRTLTCTRDEQERRRQRLSPPGRHGALPLHGAQRRHRSGDCREHNRHPAGRTHVHRRIHVRFLAARDVDERPKRWQRSHPQLDAGSHTQPRTDAHRRLQRACRRSGRNRDRRQHRDSGRHGRARLTGSRQRRELGHQRHRHARPCDGAGSDRSAGRRARQGARHRRGPVRADRPADRIQAHCHKHRRHDADADVRSRTRSIRACCSTSRRVWLPRARRQAPSHGTASAPWRPALAAA